MIEINWPTIYANVIDVVLSSLKQLLVTIMMCFTQTLKLSSVQALTIMPHWFDVISNLCCNHGPFFRTHCAKRMKAKLLTGDPAPT
jgi:hypothetical protein